MDSTKVITSLIEELTNKLSYYENEINNLKEVMSIQDKVNKNQHLINVHLAQLIERQNGQH